MDSEFVAGEVWAPTFFGHSKFEVKNFLGFFNLQSTVDSEFFARGAWAPIFLGHTKFESKIFQKFLIYRVLLTLNFLQGGLGTNFFRSP